MLPFILGFTVGAFLLWLLTEAKRREVTLLNEQKQRLEQEKQIVVEFMHNMVEAVAQGSDRATMFQRIIHAAILSTGAMSACIFDKRSDGSLQGVAVEGLFPPQRKLAKPEKGQTATRAQFLERILKSENYQMGEGLIGQVAKSRRALLIVDALNDPRVVHHEDPSLAVRSIIVAPIIFQNKLLSVLAVANPSDGLAFTETDFSLVESLAEQVGLALHNSEAMQLQIEKNKLDLDIELASNIQGLLLPKVFPPADHIAFATHYKAAQKVGGDFYDVFSLDEHRIAFAIADVSGKGISASILMAICQTNLRHFAEQHRSPSEVLSCINRAMEHTMQRDMFITMVYAVIDLTTEQLTLARAGHELPLFYDCHTGGGLDVEPIQSPGMAVGMVPPDVFDSIIEDVSIHFGSNDALILYTDGITESINAQGEEYGSQRLLEVLEKHGEQEAHVLIEKTLESVDRFSQTSGQFDDLTLITVKHA